MLDTVKKKKPKNKQTENLETYSHLSSANLRDRINT